MIDLVYRYRLLWVWAAAVSTLAWHAWCQGWTWGP